MQETKGHNNAATLFGIKKILSDNHIRNLLDEVAPSYIFPMFYYILDALSQSGYLEMFRSFNNNLLVALDGTGYFSSQNIHCPNCIQTHQWLRANGKKLKELAITIIGDDLYCKQPMCELILEEGFDFILICKEESHKTLYEYVEFLKEDIRTVEVKRRKGKRLLLDTYRFFNSIPLRDGENALEVNWCQIITTDEQSGKVRYRNAFATKEDKFKKRNTKRLSFLKPLNIWIG